jgi:hypothetical protein
MLVAATISSLSLFPNYFYCPLTSGMWDELIYEAIAAYQFERYGERQTQP